MLSKCWMLSSLDTQQAFIEHLLYAREAAAGAPGYTCGWGFLPALGAGSFFNGQREPLKACEPRDDPVEAGL